MIDYEENEYQDYDTDYDDNGGHYDDERDWGSSPYYDDEPRTYDCYNGSYAQDVEGWSDQMIDDVLDGDPDAYWNID